MASPDLSITLNQAKKRFEILTDGKLSQVNYTQPDAQTLVLTHTEVDPSLEGKGIGSDLVKQVLTYIDQHQQQVVPACPFVAAYIKRHPEWQRLVSTSYSVDEV